jgi:hypothetical protein
MSSWVPQLDADLDWVVCGRIYQQALMVYLETARIEVETDITQYIHATIDLLDILPQTAPTSVTLCWPLVMIGSRTTNEEYPEIIRQRLEAM